MLTKDQVKNNLRIDYDSDDAFIEMLMGASEATIMGAIEVKEVPNDPRFDIAQMLLIAHWFEQREATGGATSEVPFGVTSIVQQLRGLPHED